MVVLCKLDFTINIVFCKKCCFLKPNTKYEILRNIFLVAASRGKEKIVFVEDMKQNPETGASTSSLYLKEYISDTTNGLL